MNRKKYCLIVLVILSILYVNSLALSQEPGTLLREYEPILYLYPNDEYDEYVPMNLEPYVEERCSLWHKKIKRPLIPEGKLKLTFLGDPRIEDWSDFYLWFDEESKPPFSLPEVEPEWGGLERIFKPYAKAALEEYKKITDKSIIYYGRQTEDNGYIVLQYWFFYAYNPWGAYKFGINIHEGDWEMISIFLEPQRGELIPRYAAYSAHYDSGDEVTRIWDEVEKIGDHPIVYVALGSHANYFDSGLHFRKELPGLVDVTTPYGRHIGPGQEIEWDEPFILEEGNLPLWAGNYSGKWGADWKVDDGKLKDGLSGPKGPKFQGAKWDNPADWAGLPAGGWPSDPTVNVPICTAENVQYSPQLVSDSTDGAIIMWQDKRSGNFDIYVQNVQEDGSLGGISGDEGVLALAPKIFTKREISPSPDLSLRGRGEHGLPLTTKALQNYPNPFNPDTWIPYQLAVDAPVTITIYNLKGQLIRTIALGDRKAGVYVTKDRAAYWDGRDDTGEKVASGVYFYTLKAGEFIATRKMLIVK